jgi:hypothetical protein
MSILKVNAVQGTDGIERYLARAWVNFNGTGTVAIRASGNVSSITDNGTGNYRINFTNAMPDANFAFSGGYKAADDSTGSNSDGNIAPFSFSTTGVSVLTLNGAAAVNDCAIVCAAIYR